MSVYSANLDQIVHVSLRFHELAHRLRCVKSSREPFGRQTQSMYGYEGQFSSLVESFGHVGYKWSLRSSTPVVPLLGALILQADFTPSAVSTVAGMPS